jgi:AsmA protein
VHGVEQARWSALDVSPDDKTPFSELAATFNLTDGIAHTQDLRLVSAHVRIAGSGTANLPERTADYLMRLKISDIGGTPGAVINVANLEIPMRVTGSWDRLSFKPEIKGLNSEQVGEAIKQIGRNLNTPEVKEAVKGLLGGGEGQPRVKPRELLEKLLKKE